MRMIDEDEVGLKEIIIIIIIIEMRPEAQTTLLAPPSHLYDRVGHGYPFTRPPSRSRAYFPPFRGLQEYDN